MHPIRGPIPRRYLLIYLLFSVVWLVCHVVIILRFRMPDTDSIMYGLPLAFAHSPFDLKIPWLIDFESYARTWGHNWVGGMWVRAALFSVIPYSRAVDLVVIFAALWGAATIVGTFIWRCAGSYLLTVCGIVIVLSERLMFNNLQLHRFESTAELVLMTLFAFVLTASSKSSRLWIVTGWLAAFLTPTLHPVCFAGGGVLVAVMLWRGFVVRSVPAVIAASTAAFALAGVAALASWFYFQPDAWEQFTANIQFQKTFQNGYLAIWSGLGWYHLKTGYVFWTLAAASSCLMMGGFCRNLQTPYCPVTFRWLPGLMFFGLAAFHTVTKGPNATYLSFQYLAGVLPIACVLQSLRERNWVAGYRTGILAYAGLTLLIGTLLPYRLFTFARAGFPDFQKVCRETLASLPPNTTVYIPAGFWGEAIHDDRHTIRLCSFLVVSPKDVRRRYEKAAYAQIKPGDYLIFDRLSGSNLAADYPMMDPFPTFHSKKLDPRYWKLVGGQKQLFPSMSTDFGYDFEIYEFIGGDWAATL